MSKTALNQLEALGVDVKLNTEAKDPEVLPNGKSELHFSTGRQLVVDLYISTVGVVPNSSFVPPQFLNASGFIKVGEYLDIKGADGVFAIGDVNDCETPQFYFSEKQSTYIAKNLVLALTNKAPVLYKASTTGVFNNTLSSAARSRLADHHHTGMIGIQIGKKTGTGHFGNFKLPSFLVIALRKTLFIDNLPKTVDGSML